MRRAILALFAVLAVASCAGPCNHEAQPADSVPEHTHHVAELGLSCAETCAPGSCSSAYGIAEQGPVSCDAEAERFALCICRAP